MDRPGSPQEQLQVRQVARDGVSPFGREKVTDPDRSVRVKCDECVPAAAFVATPNGRSAEENLTRHIEVKHSVASSSGGIAEAIERVRKVLTDRIDAGELPPGQAIKKVELMRQLNVSRHAIDTAIDELADAGRLTRATYNGRVAVAAP